MSLDQLYVVHDAAERLLREVERFNRNAELGHLLDADKVWEFHDDLERRVVTVQSHLPESEL